MRIPLPSRYYLLKSEDFSEVILESEDIDDHDDLFDHDDLIDHDDRDDRDDDHDDHNEHDDHDVHDNLVLLLQYSVGLALNIWLFSAIFSCTRPYFCSKTTIAQSSVLQTKSKA